MEENILKVGISLENLSKKQQIAWLTTIHEKSSGVHVTRALCLREDDPRLALSKF